MTYQLCKKLIESGKTFGLQNKLDVFFAANRITETEYQELIGLLGEE